jgi:hypothetical protein
MTPATAHLLDLSMDACFWITWLAVAATVICNPRIGSN